MNKRNPFPWDLPAGTSDSDPKAPWNQEDRHCPVCCPLHEDSDTEDDNSECNCDHCYCPTAEDLKAEAAEARWEARREEGF